MNWRLIDTGLADPYYVTAADDVILRSNKDMKTPNTLHFYRRNPPGVSVGRSRKTNDDINVQACHQNNVKIVRRPSGGGTIFTDKGCLIYALTLNNVNKMEYSPQKMFEKTCSVIINTLDTLGIKAEYKAPNDVLVNNKKISGSAQIRKRDSLLVHGTLLMNTDLQLMQNILKNLNPGYVTTIAQECTNLPSFSEIKKKLIDEFENIFDITIKPGSLTTDEHKLIKKLINERYCKDEWNFRR